MAKYPEMHWDVLDLQEELKLFKQLMSLCLMDNDVTDQARHCDELSERVLELVVASTPFEAFQKDLLDKPKGFMSF